MSLFSKKYNARIETLVARHMEGHLSKEEYSQETDTLIKAEMLDNPSAGQEVMRQKMLDDINQLETLYQAKRENEEQLRRKQKWLAQQEEAKEAKKRELSAWSYRQSVTREIKLLKTEAQTYKRYFEWCQVIIIVFSITATTLVTSETFPRLIVAFFSGVAAIASGLLATFKYRDKAYGYYQTSGGMELECDKYDHDLDEYHGLAIEEKDLLFRSRIKDIRQQQMSQELKFWEPTNEESKQKQSAPKSSNAPSQTEESEPEAKGQETSS